MHDRDARGPQRMGFHAGRGGYGVCLHAQLGVGLTQLGGRDVAHDERSAVEFVPACFKRLFGGFERRTREAIPQGGQSVVRVVADQENIARAPHSAGRRNRALDRSHAGIEHFGVRHARHHHVAQLAEGPAGIVVDILLRIVRRPVLVIEQCVRDAAIGLIHAQNVTAHREGARLRFRLRLGFWIGLVVAAFFRGVALILTALGWRLLGRHHHGERRAGAGDLAALFLQHP